MIKKAIGVDTEPQLIKNPFICGSSKQVRIGLDKHPDYKVGNSTYVHQVSDGENVYFHNELDSKMNYCFGTKRRPEKNEQTSMDKYDFQVPAEVLNKNRTDGKEPHSDALPLSFLQIKTEEEGIIWYEKNYPKIPKDLLPIIARYHWGEPITKKAIKNEKKKIEKKLQSQGLVVEQKKVSLSFD